MRFEGLMRSATLLAWFAIDALDSLRRVADEGPSKAEDEAGRVGGAAPFEGVPC